MARLRDQRARRRRSKSNKSGLGCIGCFGIIWMGFVLVFDGIIGYGLWRTYDAKNRYLSATGVVISSAVESSSSSDGTTYSAQVEYSFVVGEATYTGDRHSFFTFGTSSYEHAHDIVKRYPAGREITVYYDPGDANENVLEIDARSFPSIMILFLTPFHCIGVGLIVGGVVQIRHQRRGGDDAPIVMHRLRETKERLVLQDSHWRGWVVFFMTLGITSFVMIFVVAFAMGMSTNRQTVLWIWAGCVGAAILLPTLLRLRRATKHNTIEIDWFHSRFTRKPGSMNIPIGDIKTIRLTSHDTNTKVNDRPWLRHEIEGIDAEGTAHLLLIGRGYTGKGNELRDWFVARFEAAAEESELSSEDGPSMPVVSEVEINRTNS
jgi:ABC-type multidrug transport system fused ATPase/permease subunit